jgi:hypothetical protein
MKHTLSATLLLNVALFRLQQQFLNVALFCILQLHSATLHEVLPISEFKMQTAYCNTSRRVVYFEIQNTTSHAYFLVILEHTHGD